MRRFFVAPELLRQSKGIITGELFRHLSTVLRLKSGDHLCLADGCGHEAEAVIAAVDKEGIHVEIGPALLSISAGASPRITVYQGLPKGEKIDLILQKCTELGVARIMVFMAERSIMKLAGDRLEKRISRWERIVQEAARQSGREDIPSVGFSETLGAALRSDSSSLGLLFREGEEEQRLKNFLESAAKPESIAIVIGPEGGVTSEEAAKAVDAGFIPVSLGRRILRTETAGLAVVSILQYVWGDVG